MKSIGYFYAFSCILFLSGCRITHRAQLPQRSIDFLSWYFKDNEKIIHAPYLNKILIAQINEHLSNDTLKDVSYGQERSIVLSKDDKLRINKAIEENALEVPTELMLAKGHIINPDTIFIKERPETHLKAWNTFYTNYGKGYYSFTRPIFLRDKSIVIFFVQFNCGILCSKGELAVYRKINDDWEKWIVVNNWIS